MTLVKYRDAQMITHTWFYVDDDTKHQVSPFFDTEQEARAWFEKVFDGNDSD